MDRTLREEAEAIVLGQFEKSLDEAGADYYYHTERGGDWYGSKYGCDTIDHLVDAVEVALSRHPAPSEDALDESDTWDILTWLQTYARASSLPYRVCRRLDQAAEEITALRAPAGDGWISVKNELPHYGQRVLLYSGGVVQNETYTFDEGEQGGPFWDRDDLDEGVSMKESDFWQPLPRQPSPPQEGKV